MKRDESQNVEYKESYFRMTLPNLIWGFNDKQLAVTPVATPVATPVVPPVVPPVTPPVGKPSETLIDAVQRKVLPAGQDARAKKDVADVLIRKVSVVLLVQRQKCVNV